MPRKNYECCLFTSIISIIALLGVTINYCFKYSNSQKYNKLKCNITRIEYPDKIPTTVEEYNNNFIKCSCGKRCISDMGICTKIFITDIHFGEELLQYKYKNENLLSKCTFAERRCANGENIENRIYSIKENKKNVVNKYENYIKNSELIDCYEFNDVYFIDNYNYLDETIILCVFSGMLLILICVILSFCPPQ